MDFQIRKAREEDAPVFYDIVQAVWKTMEKKEWFVTETPEYYRDMLIPGHGLGYLAVCPQTDGTPSCQYAGVFLVVFPGLTEDNLGYDAALASSELPYVALMDTAAVLPACRGHHLQYRLMQTAETELKILGYRCLMCTVHPDNRYSRDTLLQQGYEFVVQKEKYGGYLRDIFLKRL